MSKPPSRLDGQPCLLPQAIPKKPQYQKKLSTHNIFKQYEITDLERKRFDRKNKFLRLAEHKSAQKLESMKLSMGDASQSQITQLLHLIKSSQISTPRNDFLEGINPLMQKVENDSTDVDTSRIKISERMIKQEKYDLMTINRPPKPVMKK